jgi:phosphatidylglycerophosphate synthase
MRQLFNEFKRCLKPIYIEEVFDLGVFRPLAFLLVKAVYPFPITPNQITVTGIVAALIGAVFLSQGTRTGFALGGLCYLIAVVFDCADGMLARLKGNGTKVGRIMDGLFDYIATTMVLTGMAIGLTKANFALPFHPLVLIVLAAISAGLQSLTVDYAKNQFVAHALSKGRPITDEVAEFEEELVRLKSINGSWAEQTLIRIYLFYSRLQARRTRPTPSTYDGKDYFRKNLIPVRLWTLIGPGTHRAMFILSGLLFQPMIYFVFAIVVGNAVMVSLLIAQTFIKRSIRQSSQRNVPQARSRRVKAIS